MLMDLGETIVPLVSREAPTGDARDVLAPLAREASQGDRAATRKLLDAVAPTVLRVVRGVLGRAHPDVDDVVQTSLVGLVRALPAFRGECQVHYFAARIATRGAMEARRKTRTARDRHEDLEEGTAAEGSPERDAVAERRRALWRSLLDELPEAQAETMHLRVVLEYSLEETAEATGVPLNTVRSRIRLAREALKKRIEGDPGLRELLLTEGAR